MLLSIIETVEASGLNLEKLYIEPGRSVVGDSGLTLYTASYVKKTYGGKNYLFVDGGMTDNIRPALYNAAYTVENASNVSGEKDLKVDVVGRCCESGDIVAKDTYINDVKENDCIVVYSTGAYCYSMSSNYNSMLKPAVIFVDDDIHVVSRREELSDLMKLYEK
jgi:diaminopimelate decarboxylase